jgi:hypothetical protein
MEKNTKCNWEITYNIVAVSDKSGSWEGNIHKEIFVIYIMIQEETQTKECYQFDSASQITREEHKEIFS